jgi:hypothetical protein
MQSRRHLASPWPACLWLAATAVLLLAPPGLRLAAAEGQRLEDGALVDEDYRFRFRQPSEAWELLAESDAKQVVATATVAARAGDDMMGFVRVEPVPEGELRGWAAIIVERMGLENKSVSEPEPGTFAGQAALTVDITGSAGGTSLGYRLVVFTHQAHLYTLLVWRVAGTEETEGRSFADFFRAFELLDGKVKTRKSAAPVPNLTGSGWNVRDNVFNSAAYQLSVEAPVGWQLAAGETLANLSQTAEVGLVSRVPEAFLLVLPEVVLSPDKSAHQKAMLEQTREGLSGVVRNETRALTVRGRPVTFVRIDTEVPQPLTFWWGALYEGDVCLQLHAWYPKGTGTEALPHIQSALDAVRPMSPAQMAAFREERGAQIQAEDGVGPDWCVRDGIVRHFGHGFVWERPAGYWRVLLGAKAAERSPGATALLTHPQSGFSGAFYGEFVARGTDPAGYHKEVLVMAFDEGHPVHKQAPQEMEVAGKKALSSTGDRLYRGLPTRYQLITLIDGDIATRLLFWALKDNFERQARLVGAALRKLEMPATARHKIGMFGGKLYEQRFGFVFSPPSDKWKLEAITPEIIRANSTLLSADKGADRILAVATAMTPRDWDVRRHMDLMQSVIVQELGIENLPTATLSRGTLAGRAADRFRWEGAAMPEVLMTVRGGNVYMLIYPASLAAAAPPEQPIGDLLRFIR